MIDKLIASDFAALAAEDRKAMPTFDALHGAPVVKPAKAPRAKGMPWLWPVIPVAFVLASTGVLSKVNRDFVMVPQLPVALAIAMIAFVGLLAPGFAKGRSSANVLAAIVFIPLATVAFLTEWRGHLTDCAFFDRDGMVVGPCQAERFLTTTKFALISWAVTILVTAVVARWIRRDRLRAWSIPAAIASVTVLLTWLGMNEYMDTSIELARFHEPWSRYGVKVLGTHDVRVMVASQDLIYGIRMHSADAQRWASETAAVLFGLAISIGIASARERAQPSRWLRLLESPAIVPLGVTIATISLVLGTAQWELFKLHRGDWDDIPWFAAWASIGAVVAYASMLLRRRRREALS